MLIINGKEIILSTIISYVDQLSILEEYIKSVNEILTKKNSIAFEKNEVIGDYMDCITVVDLLNSKKEDFQKVFDPLDHLHEILTIESLSKILRSILETIAESGEDGYEHIQFVMNATETDTQDRKIIDLNLLLDNFEISIDDKADFTVLVQKGSVRNLLLEEFSSIKKSTSHLEQLYTSSLITLANNFELLVSRIFTSYLELNPNGSSFNMKEKTISFENLTKIGSISDAKELLLEERVTSLMKESADSWFKFLEKINDKIGKLKRQRLTVIEFFQRRNIIVHNNGIVNTFYLSNVDESLRKGIKKGTRLEVTYEYILDTLDQFLDIGLTIFWWVSQRICRGEIDEIIRIYGNIAFDLLSNEKYVNSRKVYDLLLDQKDKMSNKDYLMYKINSWQTYKWNGEFEQVKDNIQAYDFTLAPSEFQMCRAILLDDNAEALVQLKRRMAQLEQNETENSVIDAYLKWPLFKEFIGDENFNSYLHELGYTVEYDIIDGEKEEGDDHNV